MIQPMQQVQVSAFLLTADGEFPNHPRLPLLIYERVLTGAGTKAAEEWERLFEANGWGGTWRNGVFSYHHYHSNAHEALGVGAGSARLQFGGPRGPILSVAAGDLAILPAGTAHKRVAASDDFLVVGAYPAGQEDYDVIRGGAEERPAAEARIAAVPLPAADPAYGTNGPLRSRWSQS